ncbi:MAG: hypothetical protein ACHRHE_09955 [Tepidisphaerales bacterium]
MARIIQSLLLLALAVPALAADKPEANRAPAGVPNIPEGARWTICCETFTDAGHMEQAKRFKEQLAQQTKMSDFYVVHSPDHSTLYYGYYREIDPKADAKEAARAAADRTTVANFIDAASGQRLFRMVMVVAMDQADPIAPPEWNLKNAKGFWSLQVAAFRDNPRRKEAAVEAARDLRKQGYEAFFFHGAAVSSVCIGAFPYTSVIVNDGPKNVSPDAPVLVAPPDMDLMQTPSDRPMVVRQRQINVTDPELLKLWKQFPTHATNYEEGRRIVKRDGTKVDKVERSFLVVIPNEEATAAATARPVIPAALLRQAGAGSDPSTPASENPVRVQVDQNPQQPVPPRAVQPAKKKPPQEGKLPGLDNF